MFKDVLSIHETALGFGKFKVEDNIKFTITKNQ